MTLLLVLDTLLLSLSLSLSFAFAMQFSISHFQKSGTHLDAQLPCEPVKIEGQESEALSRLQRLNAMLAF